MARILRLTKVFLPLVLVLLLAFFSVANAAQVFIISQNEQLPTSVQNAGKLCQFYGLSYQVLPPEQAISWLRDLFSDTDEQPLAIVICTPALEAMLYLDGLQALRRAIELIGIKVLVLFGEPYDPNARALEELTGIPGIRFVMLDGDVSSYRISNANSKVTREFTGLIKELRPPIKRKVMVITAVDSAKRLFPLVAASSTNQDAYEPIFGELRVGNDAIFVTAPVSIETGDEYLISLYNWQYFPDVVPTMMFLRYSCGDYCWHREIDYANLTLDDPNLIEPYGALSYADLLEHMKVYKFHTTVAFIPWNYDRTQQLVVNIFLENPQYFSLVIHGNNHDHREFGPYSNRTFEMQEADIVEALLRMQKLNQLTSIQYDKVMIFPHGIAPEMTLEILKKYNFLCTVNAGNVPLGSKPSPRYDLNMRPANMDYGAFPSLDRRHAASDLYIFDLFIDKPALLYGHLYSGNNLFKTGIGAFDTFADRINQLPTQLEWRSLGHIAKHLYLEKLNDDGTVSVKMFSNFLKLRNNRNIRTTFKIAKSETSNPHIAKVLVNGAPRKYSIKNGQLHLTLTIEPMQTAEIAVLYDHPLLTNKTPNKAGLKVWLLRHGSEIRDRYLSTNRFGSVVVLLWTNFGFKLFMVILSACGVLFVTISVSLFIYLHRRKRRVLRLSRHN